MKQTAHQLKINLPKDVKKWLVEQSEKNLRSQSNEVILAIRERMVRTTDHTGGSATMTLYDSDTV